MRQYDLEITQGADWTDVRPCTPAGENFCRDYTGYTTKPLVAVGKIITCALKAGLSFAVYQS